MPTTRPTLAAQAEQRAAKQERRRHQLQTQASKLKAHQHTTQTQPTLLQAITLLNIPTTLPRKQQRLAARLALTHTYGKNYWHKQK